MDSPSHRGHALTKKYMKERLVAAALAILLPFLSMSFSVSTAWGSEVKGQRSTQPPAPKTHSNATANLLKLLLLKKGGCLGNLKLTG